VHARAAVAGLPLSLCVFVPILLLCARAHARTQTRTCKHTKTRTHKRTRTQTQMHIRSNNIHSCARTHKKHITSRTQEEAQSTYTPAMLQVRLQEVPAGGSGEGLLPGCEAGAPAWSATQPPWMMECGCCRDAAYNEPALTRIRWQPFKPLPRQARRDA